jgi:hypothetical protein
MAATWFFLIYKGEIPLITMLISPLRQRWVREKLWPSAARD